MIKAYGVIGSALTGALTGWLALGLWQWGEAAEQRSCEGNNSFCVTLYPLTGLLVWITLAVLVFAIVLPLMGVRPRKSVAAACCALQMYTLAVLGPLAPHDVPETTAVNLTALALGPALVAVCTVPTWRRAGLIAIGALMTAAFLAVFGRA